MAYKKDQGRFARMAAFWSLAILAFYGCTRLYRSLTMYGRLSKPIGGGRLPVVGLDLSPALLVSVLVFTGALYALYRWQQTPKVADTLIDTEHELRKVTWPTFDEAVQSSLVVLFTVIALMAFLAGSDWLLGRIFTRFLIS